MGVTYQVRAILFQVCCLFTQNHLTKILVPKLPNSLIHWSPAAELYGEKGSNRLSNWMSILWRFRRDSSLINQIIFWYLPFCTFLLMLANPCRFRNHRVIVLPLKVMNSYFHVYSGLSWTRTINLDRLVPMRGCQTHVWLLYDPARSETLSRVYIWDFLMKLWKNSTFSWAAIIKAIKTNIMLTRKCI